MSPALKGLFHPKQAAREAANQRYAEAVGVVREYLDAFDPAQKHQPAPDMVRMRPLLEDIHESDDLETWARARFVLGVCGALAVSPPCTSPNDYDPQFPMATDFATQSWRMDRDNRTEWLALAGTALARHPSADTEVARDLGRDLPESFDAAGSDLMDPAKGLRRVAGFWTAVFRVQLPEQLSAARLAGPLLPDEALTEVRQRREDIAMEVCVAAYDNARAVRRTSALMADSSFTVKEFEQLTVDYVTFVIGKVLDRYAAMAPGATLDDAQQAAQEAARDLGMNTLAAHYAQYRATSSVFAFEQYQSDAGLGSAREMAYAGVDAFAKALAAVASKTLLRGGMGEPYCSQRCYDEGGAAITTEMLRGVKDVECHVCNRVLDFGIGTPTSMVYIQGRPRYFHQAQECDAAVRAEVGDLTECVMCGTATTDR